MVSDTIILKPSDAEDTALEFAFGQFLEGGFGDVTTDGNIGVVVKDVYFPDLCSGDAVLTGQSTQNIARSYFLLFATANEQCRHRGFVGRFFEQVIRRQRFTLDENVEALLEQRDPVTLLFAEQCVLIVW